VVREPGPGWDSSRTRVEQDGWPAHAAFMNALAEEGFVVLGGPLAGTLDVLVVFDAASPEEIEARLADDPWTPTRTLRTKSVRAWQILLDRSAEVQPRADELADLA
jgi:uncharacterized protein YciI